MSNAESYKLIGERASELAKNEKVQLEMLKIADRRGKQEAEKYLYMISIATLAGL